MGALTNLVNYFQYLILLGCVLLLSTKTLQLQSTISNGCNMCKYTDTYEHIVISGLPYERGLMHGKSAKNKIHKMINNYKTSSSMPPWEDCVRFVEDNYIIGLLKYYPNGLEEMKGIADGANATLNDIIILNARYDLSRWKRSLDMKAGKVKTAKLTSDTAQCHQLQVNKNTTATTQETLVDDLESSLAKDEEECTGAVALKSATLNNEVLLGQNWDTSEFLLMNDTAILLEVHPELCENIEPFVTLTEAGQLVRSGMNANGLGLVAMSLWSSNEVYERDVVKYPNGWVPATLLRRMFLEAATFPIGLKAILSTPRHVAMNVIVASGEDEALNIELTPDAYYISQVPIEKEILTHSNHFKSQAFMSKDSVTEGSRGSSSLFRDRRVEHYLLKHLHKIEEKTFQEAFKDHVGYPNSVCQHSVPKELAWTSTHPTETTVASFLFNLSKRTMQLCKGPPCQGSFKSYQFPFSI